MDKLTMVLGIISAVTVGLPALLRAIHMFLLALLAFLKLIPGPFGEAAVEKLAAGVQSFLGMSEKMGEVAGKLFPKPKV